MFFIGGKKTGQKEQEQVLGDLAGLKGKSTEIDIHFYTAALRSCADQYGQYTHANGQRQPGKPFELVDLFLFEVEQGIEPPAGIKTAGIDAAKNGITCQSGHHALQGLRGMQRIGEWVLYAE